MGPFDDASDDDPKKLLARQIAQAAQAQAGEDGNAPKPLAVPAPDPTYDPHGPADPARGWRWAALMGGGLADAITTHNGLKNGAQEGNPIMSPFAHNDAALFASKIGMNALLGLLADKMHKSGYTGEANALGFGLGAAQGGVAAANVLTNKKQSAQNAKGGS